MQASFEPCRRATLFESNSTWYILATHSLFVLKNLAVQCDHCLYLIGIAEWSATNEYDFRVGHSNVSYIQL